MPFPVAFLLNRPWMTLTLPLIGSSGFSDLLSSKVEPEPFAHQCSGLMPVPMNRTPKRFGARGKPVSAARAVAPKPESDSSHGSAIVTPTPRKKVRREMARAREFAFGVFTRFGRNLLICRRVRQ